MFQFLYYKESNKSKAKFKHKILFFAILFLLQIKSFLSVNIDSCKGVTSYSNTACFNDKIEFHSNFRAGHFETLADGTLIIEYSCDSTVSKRFFYGLKKNGRYYFPHESAFKRFNAYNPENSFHGRFESKNKIVYLYNDLQKKKQYLFSTSIWTTVTELHNIETGDSNYWDTVSFWDIVEIFSYEINILEIQESNENRYICVFTQKETEKRWTGSEYEDYSTTFSIRKIKFNTFRIYTLFDERTDYKSNYNCRMISSFIVYDYKILVIFFLKRADDDPNKFENARYTIVFYNYQIEWINEIDKGYIGEANSGTGIFFRAVHLENKFAAFLYNKDKYGGHLVFDVGEMADYYENGKKNYKFNYRIELEIKDKWYAPHVNYNDFFKVDNKRLVFVTTKDPNDKLGFIVFDLYNNYYNYRIRSYFYNDVSDKLFKEIQGYTYNGYTIFTFCSNSNDIYSTLLFFGYANGTDFEIDISPYLMDTGYYNSFDNLYTRLMESCKIDNNIFGYEIVPKINLVYYPDELLFYNGSGYRKEKNKLPNNSFFDANHTLNQNFAINKTNKLYYLEYQFIVKEPKFDTFYATPPVHEILGDNTGGYFKDEFVQKTFYGRTNRLYFKLCYEYCNTCIEFGKSQHDQRCMTCLEEYTYDYWIYMKKYFHNCIPEGRYYNNITRKLETCAFTTYKYFYVPNKKRICFKSIFDCPPDYHYLNKTTRECLNITIPTTILKIPTTIITTIPTTIPKIPTTLPKEIPTTIITTIPTTIPKIPTTLPKITPTTIVTTIPTTIPTKIPTTLPKEIPTTIVTTIPTTIPKIPTTLPKIIPTTIITTIPTTIPKIPTSLPKIIPSTIITTIPTTIPKIPTTLPKIIHTTIPNIIPTTIVTKISTTIVTTIPIVTTLPKHIPSTIITTVPKIIPTTIPTTIPKKIPTTITTTIPDPKITTIISQIPTTNLKKILTTIPSPIAPTTVPKAEIQSTIPSPIMSTIPEQMNYNICTYYVYLHYNCSFYNLTNDEILIKLKKEMLKTYPSDGLDVEINAVDGYGFQFTNSFNQLVANDSHFSNIDLGECESKLKRENGIDPNISLIFFKFERIRNNNKRVRDIQYEVYNPLNYESLNLSICEKMKVKVVMQLEMSQEVAEMIQSILAQGYNPFDLNDKFYREICTPYNSENGTDVLLDDREEYIYSTIKSEMSCPDGCEMSSYSLDSKYISCECDPNDNGIVGVDLKHISEENVYESVLSTLKNTNYKVMKCYNLVFNFKIFCHNYESIITLIFFLIYVGFMINYCCKDITPIKVSVSKYLFEEQQKDINEFNNNTAMKTYVFNAKSETKSKKITKNIKNHKKKQAKSTKDFAPPKKGIHKIQYNTHKPRNKNNSFERKKQEGDIKLIDIAKFRRRNAIKCGDLESVKSDKVRKRKSIIDYQTEMALKTKDQLLSRNGNEKSTNLNNMPSQKTLFSKGEYDGKEKEKRNQECYDNFELNNMNYNDAGDLDKRSCIRTYWSVLLREHYVLFTFLSRNDYNLFYVKIERFFILICTEMTMNGLFFVHETMYKKQTGDLSFAQKIPQFIFSILVTHAIEVILCYLSMTDVHYYEIKALPQEEKKDEKIFDILTCVRRKLTGFFIFTFLLFLFHWYFISAFCAVYQNTQVIFLRDCGISVLTSLIDPFIIYALTCALRAISLSKCCKKKLCCIYKLSDLIPIF